MKQPSPIGRLDLEGRQLESALRRLEHYCRAAGVPGHLIDTAGTCLGAFDAEGRRTAAAGAPAGGLCPICALWAARSAAEVEKERRSQVFAAYQAERFGGKYIQLCPHSLLFWASPIIVDGIMSAAFVGGPVMVVEAEEVFAELESSGSLPEGAEAALRSALEAAPRVSPRRATSLAETLSDIAAAFGAAACGAAPFGPKLERQEIEAKISERIQELKDRDEGPLYPIEKERELRLAISKGDKKEAQSLLNEILGHVFFSSGGEARVVKARTLELVVLLSRAALDGGADMEQILGLNFTYLDQLTRMRSVDDIASWLSRIMVRFTDLVFNLKDVKHSDVIQRAIRYINAHFQEEMTLNDVARSVYLSPTYFSKLFSEEMGCHFTTYLNRMRIEKSKILLRNPDIALVDIAGMVGYEDQSYFTKVFKRFAGLPPGKYRESGGRASGDSQEIHEEPTKKDKE